MKLLRAMCRLLWLPFRLLIGATKVFFRVGWFTGRLPIRASMVTVRALGLRGIVLFGLGLVLGLLFAPIRGRELRERLIALAQGGALSDEELAERVSFELSHAPRTWHLNQPEVVADAGRVVLSGEVADAEMRRELLQTALAVPGVVSVDDSLGLAETDE